MNKLNPYDKIHIGALVKYIFIRTFSNKYFVTLYNLSSTAFITFLASQGDLSKGNNLYKFIICIILQIILNILSIIADKTKSKTEKNYVYLTEVYNILSHINAKNAVNLYRVNKKIINIVKNMKCEKGAINSIADFQTLSFFICSELHNFLINNFDCGECEVTIFQRFSRKNNEEFVKMIAYKNSRDNEPSSYNKEFKLNTNANKPPVFINLFKDLNAEPKILHTPESIANEFQYLDGSDNREKSYVNTLDFPLKQTEIK